MSTVYRFFDADGGLLYVGCTDRWPRRMGEHRTGKPWWHEVASVTLQHFDSRAAANAAELAALESESPRHTTTPARVAGRTWLMRQDAAANAHAERRFCGRAGCVQCGLRRYEAIYREQRRADLIADIRSLRERGVGRWRTSLIIAHRLGVDRGHGGFTETMVRYAEAGQVRDEVAS